MTLSCARNVRVTGSGKALSIPAALLSHPCPRNIVNPLIGSICTTMPSKYSATRTGPSVRDNPRIFQGRR